MNLQLYVQDKLIASLPIDVAYMSYPQYLPLLKSELEKTHEEVITTAKTKPVFYIDAQRTDTNKRFNNRPLL